MKKFNRKDVINALRALWVIRYRQGTFYPFRAYEGNVIRFVHEYLQKHRDMKFVGLPHVATSQDHLCIDGPNQEILMNSTSEVWKKTLTGRGTFDEHFPDTASKAVRLDPDPDHWMYLIGFMELGSANNLNRIFFSNINGRPAARVSISHINRLAEFRFFPIKPALKFRSRDSFNIDLEGEVAAPTEVLPVCIHILPREIANAEDQSAYTTEITV